MPWAAWTLSWACLPETVPAPANSDGSDPPPLVLSESPPRPDLADQNPVEDPPSSTEPDPSTIVEPETADSTPTSPPSGGGGGGSPKVVASAEVIVDAGVEIREIPRSLYGTNIEWIYSGYGIWNDQQADLDATIVQLARDLNLSLLRFPGGIFSDYYHWLDGVGPQQDRPLTPYVLDGPLSAHTFGTDEALRFARETGARLLVTVNAGTGTAQEAADWVRYVNLVRAGSGDSDPVVYWEVGNELYDRSENPVQQAVAVSAEEYADRFVQFAAAMRAVDPTIRIGAITCESYNPYIRDACAGWTESVLIRAGSSLDFLSIHNAYAPMLFDDTGLDLRAVYAAMLAAPTVVADNLAELSSQIEQLVPDRGDDIRIAVTEWGQYFQADPAGRFVDHVKTAGSALYAASALKAFIESPRTDVANAFKLVDNAFMGWIGLREEQYIPKAPFYALQMFSRHFGTILVHTAATSPTYDSQAIGLVPAVGAVPYLEVVSSLSGDRRTLYLIAINKHFDEPIQATIQLRSFSPLASGNVWVLTATGIDANTGTELPDIPGLIWAPQAVDVENPRFNFGGPGEVTVDTATISIFETFTYTFEPYSITALEIPSAD
jgi:alpha-N-arabinofuranosidase